MSLQEYRRVYMACICLCQYRKLPGMSSGSICSRLALHQGTLLAHTESHFVDHFGD